MKTIIRTIYSWRSVALSFHLGMLAWILTSLPVQSAEPWTLSQVIQCALTNNPDSRLAEQRIMAAEAGLRQARAAFSPQLQFQSSYLRTDNPMLVFGSILNQQSFSSTLDFNHVPDIDNLNVRGVITLPLYAGGRNAAGRDAARANTQSAEQNYDAVRNALAFEAARAFFNVIKTREFIRATEAGVHSFETNLAIANKRLSAGTLLKNEALDVEVRLAQAREDLARARNSQALALHSLKNLLGLELDDFAVAASAPAITAPDSGDFSRRPELAAYQYRQRAAEAEMRKARSGHLPRLNAFASGDYDYGWKFEGDGESYTAGLMLQWDWWDGQLTRAKIQQARAGFQSSQEELRKVRLALSLEVEQARLALNEANERLLVTEKVVAQAAESVDLTRARFEQGLALATQLIDAETALIAARVRRAEAEADHHVAVAAVRKALGLPQMDSPFTPK